MKREKKLKHQLCTFLSWGMEKEAIRSLCGRCFDVESVQAMSTFGEEVDTYCFEAHETVDKRPEVWTVLQVTREGAKDKVDMDDDDREHGNVCREERVTEHLPESGAAVLNVTEGQA